MRSCETYFGEGICFFAIRLNLDNAVLIGRMWKLVGNIRNALYDSVALMVRSFAKGAANSCCTFPPLPSKSIIQSHVLQPATGLCEPESIFLASL